ncbi:tRNA dihydrouridine synthase DusB [Desulfosoma caldarium]|nr:tRNA dihydrouridine synthase DusB [Desulfosoma caldarium]
MHDDENVLCGTMQIGAVTVDPPVVMAPMAGVTDGPFLSVVSRFGVGMVTSEMMSAEGCRRKDPSAERILAVPARVSVPTAIQIFGAHPEVMGDAARAAEDRGAAVIDINAGCPVRKIVRQGAGAALLLDPDRLMRLVETVKRAVSIPVTVKTRLGWDKNTLNVLDVCRRLERAGADAVTVHARTARQIYSGQADWTWIGELKRELSIPVIGNGDVTSPSDFFRMKSQTGCDAVMIGRGALGNPWLFQVIAQLCRPQRAEAPRPQWEDFRRTVHELAEMFIQEKPKAIGALKKHLVWYTKGCPNASVWRYRLMSAPDGASLLNVFDAYVLELAASQADVLTCKVRDNGLAQEHL